MLTKNEILAMIHSFGHAIGALDRPEFRLYLTEHLGVPEDEVEEVRERLRHLSRVWLPKENGSAPLN